MEPWKLQHSYPTWCGRQTSSCGAALQRKLCLIAVLTFPAIALCAADATLSGRVTNENNAPVAGARILLKSGQGPEIGTSNLEALSDQAGNFVFHVPTAGKYLITAQREGYFELLDQPVQLDEGNNEIALVLNPRREVFETVDVVDSPPLIDLNKTASQERLDRKEIQLQPYPNTHELRNALQLLPGTIEDSRGGIHLNGGAEEQGLYLLDGFNITDPLTGLFDSHMSVEAVRSLELSSGLYPAEFGKGSAGVLALRTETGDDKLRYSATNFLPGIANRKGWEINAWTPRVNLSGPIRKGRAWFSESLDAQYSQNVIQELPEGQDRSSSWRVSSLLRNQINLTPSNILFTGFLFNDLNARRTGLSALDPIQTTVDRRGQQYFVDIKDQMYFHERTLFEIGFAANRNFGHEIPQGDGLYLLTPNGRGGNYYTNADRKAQRDQWLANLFLPSFTFLGSHQIKTGIDLDRVNYWQDIVRTGYETYRVDGTLLSRVLFGGSGLVSLPNVEVASYVQDSWRITPALLVEMGLRQDWDQKLGNVAFSPRFGFAWAPPETKETKISGGYAIVYDATNLRLFTPPLDQYSVGTVFREDGTIERGPSVTAYMLDGRHLDTPRYENWTLGVEHRFPKTIYARFDYLRKRSENGFAYFNSIEAGQLPSPQQMTAFGTNLFDALYSPANLRRDVYDSYQFTVRHLFRNQYQWFASYIRSQALSNALIDVPISSAISTINTAQVPFLSSGQSPMPWDSPNHFLSWGYLPTLWKSWSVAYLLDWRTGFPFSVHDEAGHVVGEPNSFRFPNYFELNLHIERRMHLWSHWWAFRLGINNLTNHKNPNLVNDVITSPQYLTFYGGQTRAFTFRIRWLENP